MGWTLLSLRACIKHHLSVCVSDCMVAKTISAEDECQKGDTGKALVFSDTSRQVKSNEISSWFNKLIPPDQKG